MSEPSYALCGQARIQQISAKVSVQRIDGYEVPTVAVSFEFYWKLAAYRKTLHLILN